MIRKIVRRIRRKKSKPGKTRRGARRWIVVIGSVLAIALHFTELLERVKQVMPLIHDLLVNLIA